MSHNETGIVNRLAGCRYRGKGDPPQECDYPTCGCDLWNAPSSASEAHSRGIPVFGAAGAFGGEQFGPPSTNERLVGSYQPKHDADCSARLCGANDATGNVCGERAGHYPHSDDSDYGVHHEFVGQACTCGLASALLREQAQQAEIQPPLSVDEATKGLLWFIRAFTPQNGAAERQNVDTAQRWIDSLIQAVESPLKQEIAGYQARELEYMRELSRRQQEIETLKERLESAARDRDALTDVLVEHADGLIGYVVDNGPLHEDDCPCDDTCDCSEKPKNDAANAICKLAESLRRDALIEERDRQEQKDDDFCAGLIHQAIPDMAGTLPRPNNPKYAAIGKGFSGSTDSLDEAVRWVRNNKSGAVYERMDGLGIVLHQFAD